MTARTYLILIEDVDLALAVGAALEDRMAKDGYRAVALVPTPSGHLSTLTGQLVGAGPRPPGISPGSARPHVVALYEDGLLGWLKSVGLPAYASRSEHGPDLANWRAWRTRTPVSLPNRLP